MNFIDLFIRHADAMESPLSYIKWAAITTLSAVMRDNLYFEDDYGKIFPNIYCIIVAKSSATRKDPPVRLAEKLIRKIGNTKVIAGRASIQGVMRVLSEDYTNKESGIRLKGARAVLLSKELADLLVDDAAATKMLTDWYDCHDIWEDTLRGSGTRLDHICITLFAASNDELFKDVFRRGEIYGGLLARTIIITENRRRKKNSRMYRRNGDENYEDILVQHLRKISRLEGPVEFDAAARAYYDDWYNSLDDEKYDKAGVIARLHTQVLKVAMILAAAHFDFERIVRLPDVEYALTLCTELIKNYQSVSFGMGKAPTSEPSALIIQDLSTAPEFVRTREQLLQRLLGDVDSEMLDKAVTTLTESGFLLPTQVRNKVAYQLTSKFFEEYERKAREIIQ